MPRTGYLCEISGKVIAENGDVLERYLDRLRNQSFEVEVSDNGDNTSLVRFGYSDYASYDRSGDLERCCKSEPACVRSGMLSIERASHKVYVYDPEEKRWTRASEYRIFLTDRERELVQRILSSYRPDKAEEDAYLACRAMFDELEEI